MEKLFKKIKKDIYGKPQNIIAVPPSGFKQTALDEINSILNNLWFPQKYSSECDSTGKNIYIKNIHLFAVTELLMRTRCLSDLRLVIFSGNVGDIRSFKNKCRNIAWHYFLNPDVCVKLKINAVPGKAAIFKNILAKIFNEHHIRIVNTYKTEIPMKVFVDLQHEKLTISISLSGDPLYKRGYRGILSASAPLREDIAACCIVKSLQFAKQFNDMYLPETIFVPFSGTGTFAFEYLQYYLNFSPALLKRQYMLEKMPLFRSENFNFLLKKCIENCSLNKAPDTVKNLCFICMDIATKANQAFAENIVNFINLLKNNRLPISEDMFDLIKGNFIDFDAINLKNPGHVFIPLNPPYGIRLAKNNDTVDLYKKIAHKIKAMARSIREQNKSLAGFVLCPDEATWSVFCRNLSEAKLETYHVNQGGMDIRICQFFML